jgi:hypothetical protein
LPTQTTGNLNGCFTGTKREAKRNVNPGDQSGAMTDFQQPIGSRHVGPSLATAIIGLPLIFYWVLLRRGYAWSTRRAAFTYMIVSMLPGAIMLATGG